MNRVAVATCRGGNVDPDEATLRHALDDVGLDADVRAWDDSSAEWASYDLVVIRSTWDYASRCEEFLAWARSIERLANPFEAVSYSIDKRYLLDLARRGVTVIPSSVVAVGESATLPEVDFVVKPCVGAGSIDAARYRGGDPAAAAHVASLHARGRDALIQPYVESVDTLGERALIFVDGSLTHAMTKAALLNEPAPTRTALYRRERMSPAAPEPEAVAVAREVLDATGCRDLLYARVNLVTLEGRWAVMEVELIEPSLFLTYCEPAAARLAEAIERRVRAR